MQKKELLKPRFIPTQRINSQGRINLGIENSEKVFYCFYDAIISDGKKICIWVRETPELDEGEMRVGRTGKKADGNGRIFVGKKYEGADAVVLKKAGTILIVLIEGFSE